MSSAYCENGEMVLKNQQKAGVLIDAVACLMIKK